MVYYEVKKLFFRKIQAKTKQKQSKKPIPKFN